MQDGLGLGLAVLEGSVGDSVDQREEAGFVQQSSLCNGPPSSEGPPLDACYFKGVVNGGAPIDEGNHLPVLGVDVREVVCPVSPGG